MSELLSAWSTFTERYFKRRVQDVSNGVGMEVDFLPLVAPEKIEIKRAAKLDKSASGRLILAAAYMDAELPVSPEPLPINVIPFEKNSGALPMLAVLRAKSAYSLSQKKALA